MEEHKKEFEMFEGDGENNLSSVFIYAGTPTGFPPELLRTHFGVLNKQLAFANWSNEDVENIIEEIIIDYLKTISSCRRHELKKLNQRAYSQIRLISMGLASLGKNGYLLEKATTSVKEYRESREREKKGFWFIGGR